MNWRINTLSERDDSRHSESRWHDSEGHHWHCTGPCDQGRKQCPCPESCGQPDAADIGYGIASLLLLVLSALFVVIALGSLGAWLAERAA